MKRFIVGFAILGLVGCFLPLAGGVSLFDFHSLAWWPVLTMLAAFAVPAVLGNARGVAASLGAAAAFGYVLYRFDFTGVIDMVVHGGIGAKMMAVGGVGGLLASIGSLLDARTPARG